MSSRCRKRLVELLLGAALAAANSGCGGSGGGSSSPPPPAIGISPATITVQPGSTQQFTATISIGGSVTWTLACSSMPCGRISPTSTASGTPTTYTPPVTLPAANLSVTLTATSTADSTEFASASATVPQIAGFAGLSESHVDMVNGNQWSHLVPSQHRATYWRAGGVHNENHLADEQEHQSRASCYCGITTAIAFCSTPSTFLIRLLFRSKRGNRLDGNDRRWLGLQLFGRDLEVKPVALTQH